MAHGELAYLMHDPHAMDATYVTAELEAHLARWTEQHTLGPMHVDCVTAVMLKILDGKCKMRTAEKLVKTDVHNLFPGQGVCGCNLASTRERRPHLHVHRS